MKALFDTHAFLWAITGQGRLSRNAQQVFTGANDLWFSVASIWELLIKARLGKLRLPPPVGPYLVHELAENAISILPIRLDHVLRLEELPLHHRDPFDRLLIAQSIEEDLPIVTADPLLAKYSARLIW